MKDDDTILLLFGLYLLSRYSSDWAPALRQGGVEVYELTHDDAGHKRDLPRPERMDVNVKQRVGELTALAKQVGFPNPQLAAAIAMAESGGRAHAVSRSPRETSVGLWQINILAHKQYSEDYLKNEVDNARAALKISKNGQDWRPWTVYKTGAYKRYLPQGVSP